MTEQTLLNHFNVWSDEHLIKEVVPEDIQKMLSCPESKTLHTKYAWEMPEWVRMDPQQKEAWYNYHKARTLQLVKDIRSGKIPPEQWPEVLPPETLRVVQENHLYSAEKEV